MRSAITLSASTLLLLFGLTGCILQPDAALLAAMDPGEYYVEAQGDKLFAAQVQGGDWVELEGAAWFEGAGVYQLDTQGIWQLDPASTAALNDQTQQLTDSQPH